MNTTELRAQHTRAIERIDKEIERLQNQIKERMDAQAHHFEVLRDLNTRDKVTTR